MSLVVNVGSLTHGGRSVSSLPYEIRRMIFDKSESVTSVRSLALTCWAFYEVYQNDEKYIMRAVVLNTIPSSIMFLVIARYEASKANWKPNGFRELPLGKGAYINGVRTFCDTFIRPYTSQHLLSTYNFTFKVAESIQEFHHVAVRAIQVMTHEAMTCRTHPICRPSTTELCRLVGAGYIYELAIILFSFGDGIRRNGFDTCWRYFWLSFPPWQGQQVRCLERSLEEHLGYTLGGRSLYAGLRAWESPHTGSFDEDDLVRSSVPHDSGLWLPTVSGSGLSLDISSVLKKYKDEGSMPCKTWFFLIGEDTINHSQFDTPYKRNTHISPEAYITHERVYIDLSNDYDVFWDRSRLERMYAEFPAMEAMYAALKDVVVERCDLSR
ncbi:hypothetical protein F5B20DRAFT_579429 [Whalleya microplaca]|nr:hypothetical protein F5B20DRAFT_579429 [Whalleya microplaca]